MKQSDLKNLSKEEKLKLLSAIDEKDRRNKLKKDVFTPHSGQLRVIQSKSKNKYVFCSNGFGKTALGVNVAKWHAEGYNPITKERYKVPTKVTVLLDHPSKVADTWLPEIRKWMSIEEDMLKKNGKPFYNEIRLKNGSSIQFVFHEQPDMFFESTEYQVIIADEPFARRIFVAMKRGMRTKNRDPYFYMFGTPISQRWLRTDIYEPWLKGQLRDVECFKGGIEENRSNLREGYIEDFSQYLTDEEKKIRLEGQFFDLGSLALAHLFNRDTHMISKESFNKEFDKRACPCVVAVDPHGSKPHVAMLLGVNKDNQLFFIDSMCKKLVARDFAKEIKAKWGDYKILNYICDSLGSTDHTGGEGFKSFIQVCNEVLGRGRMRSTTYKEKSDEDFIQRIRDVLLLPKESDNFGRKRPKLLIVEGNEEIVRDIENASWQKDRDGFMKDKLDIRLLDHLACLKYALAANLFYKRGYNTKVYRPQGGRYGFNSRR